MRAHESEYALQDVCWELLQDQGRPMCWREKGRAVFAADAIARGMASDVFFLVLAPERKSHGGRAAGFSWTGVGSRKAKGKYIYCSGSLYIMYTEYSILMSRWTMIARSKDEVEEDERWNGKKKKR